MIISLYVNEISINHITVDYVSVLFSYIRFEKEFWGIHLQVNGHNDIIINKNLKQREFSEENFILDEIIESSCRFVLTVVQINI